MDNTERKYEFTEKTKKIGDIVLHRIRAVKDFYIFDGRTNDEIVYVPKVKLLSNFFNYRLVKKGDLGGWIEKEWNLDQEGPCWVADEACVYGDAHVSGSATVCDRAQVYDRARIAELASVHGHARVHGHASLEGRVQICEHADVATGFFFGSTTIYGHAQIAGEGPIEFNGDTEVFGRAKIILVGSECDATISNSEICREVLICVAPKSALEIRHAIIDYDINVHGAKLHIDEKTINVKPYIYTEPFSQA